MRRILPIIVPVIVLGLLFAAASWARDGQGSSPATTVDPAASRAAAPFDVPDTAPKRDASQSGFVYGYRSAASLGAEMEAAAAPERAREAKAAGSGTVLVTATVLAGVNVTLSKSGEVEQLVTNTDERDVRDVLIVVPRPLDAATWAKVRSALREARAGTGTIWAA